MGRMPEVLLRRSAATGSCLILLWGAACGGGASVSLEWTGSDTGRAVLPATARRCGAGPVELLAMSGDTGVGLTIHGPVPLASGTFPISHPDQAASAPPAAALAARWLDSVEITGYRGMEGSLELTRTAPIRGSFTARAERWGGGTGEVTITGRVQDVPIGPCDASDSTG